MTEILFIVAIGVGLVGLTFDSMVKAVKEKREDRRSHRY